MSYHSQFCGDKTAEICCGIPLLPLKGDDKSGAAPRFQGEGQDIVDEAIEQFRAQIMFTTFKPQGPADKIIVFLTSFIQKVLEQWSKHQKNPDKVLQIGKELVEWDIETNSPDFIMNKLGQMHKAKNGGEEAKMKKYLKLCKQETFSRLHARLTNDKTGDMDRKFWLVFGKKPYLGHKFCTKNWM